MVETKKGNLFCYIGNSEGRKGVGFIIRKKWREKLISFKGISDRIAMVKIGLENKNTVTIIQVYAPTSTSSEEESDELYETLKREMKEVIKTNKKNKLIIMGDFNSQVGQRRMGEENTIGKYTYGERNEKGDKLIQFCMENELKVINTMFKKRKGRRWTWISPNMKHRNQIDYILTPTQNQEVINFDVVSGFRFHSDHRLIKCTLRIDKSRYYNKKTENIKWVEEKSRTQYCERLNGILREEIRDQSVEGMNRQLIKAIKIASNDPKINEMKTKNKTESPKIPVEIKNLINKREEMKKRNHLTVVEKIEFNLICKVVKQKLRKYNEDRRNEMIQEILENTRNNKKIRKKLSIGKTWISYLRDEEGKKVYSRDGILEIATRYYKRLYDDNEVFDREVEKIERDEEELPEIIEAEVGDIVQKLKCGKATSPDNISNEHIKYGERGIIKYLTKIFNKILIHGKTPDEWGLSDVIIMFKKGDKHSIENYRPLSLSSTLAKIFTKVIANRLKNTLESQQPKEQAGFRRNFSTIDHLFTIDQMIQKCEEYNKKLYLTFIDYTKAFDSVKHESVYRALERQGVEKKYIQVIMEMYGKLKARIKMDKTGEAFEIRRGVRQGDPLSSFLFNCTLESVFREMDWSKKGINVNGEYMNNLRYADDVVLIATSEEELEEMIQELNEKGKMKGLTMNINKTKVLTKGEENKEIKIDGKKIEVTEIIYLGQKITLKNNTTEEIDRRIALGWKKFWSLKHILKGPFSNKSKSQIMNSCVLPTITYGAQT